MEHTVEKNHVRPVARAGPVLRALTGVALALLAFAVLAGCGKTTKPKEVKYNIYIGATGWREATSATRFDQFFVYDADSLTVRDSIPLPGEAWELEVSPDGRWLYAQCANLYKIDALTKQVVWSIPRSGSITLLDDGKVLMRESLEMEVIDPATGRVITRLPSTIRTLKGPPNGTKVAAIVADSTVGWYDTTITVYDVRSGAVYGRYIPRLSTGEALEMIYTARLHPDSRRVMVIGRYGSIKYCWFMVGDVETGETLLRQRLYSPFGEIAVSEDGALAVASDPSQPLIWESRLAVEFFDLISMKHLKTLDEYSGLFTPAPSQVRFLRQDRKIVIAPYQKFSGWPFCIVDRTTLTVENTVQQPYNGLYIGVLGVGPRP